MDGHGWNEHELPSTFEWSFSQFRQTWQRRDKVTQQAFRQFLKSVLNAKPKRTRKEVHGFMQNGQTRVSRGQPTNVYGMPPLAECRKYFDDNFDGPWDWGVEIEEPEDAGPPEQSELENVV